MRKFFAALGELFHWLRVREEIRAKRLLLEEMDRADSELDDLERAVQAARSSGKHMHADRLLERYTIRLLYRAGLHHIADGADIGGGSGHGPGDRDRDPAEGSTDTGLVTRTFADTEGA